MLSQDINGYFPRYTIVRHRQPLFQAPLNGGRNSVIFPGPLLVYPWLRLASKHQISFLLHSLLRWLQLPHNPSVDTKTQAQKSSPNKRREL